MPILGVTAGSKRKGITFTQSLLPATRKWSEVAYDDAHSSWFVLCTDPNSTNGASSTDGLTWTARTTSRSTSAGLGAGPSFFATMQYAGTGEGSYSNDGGVNWSNMTLPMDYYYFSGKNSTYMVIMSHYGNGVSRSTNGYTWSSSTMTVGQYWNGVAWNGSVWAAVGGNSTTIANSSTDGATWTARTLPVSQTWNGVIWDGVSKFWAWCDDNTINATSPDGVTWTQILGSKGYSGMRVGVLKDTMYASDGATQVAKSTNTGLSWTSIPLGYTSIGQGWGNQHYTQNATKDKFVFVSNDGGYNPDNKVYLGAI